VQAVYTTDARDQQPADFDRLNAVHVAGTKGKGSTSSFVSSILGQYVAEGKVTKTGLYTSPHLRFVRERIQIDNKPLTEEQFAKYFFETWNRLEAAAKAAGHADPSSKETKPVYFRFLTLMALHTYISEGVDAAVIECGIGGEFDSTNILVKPSVTAVTSLGIDHVAMLGDTIDSIAWHKAGVFKPDVPAFSAPQPEEAIRVLHERAAERKTTLQVVDIHPELANIKLGLAADFQKTNASVAIAAATAYLRRAGVEDLPTPSYLPSAFRKGLEQVHLGGRCETRTDTTTPNLKWHIDGGHTLESIELAARWFGSLISSSPNSSTRILIFNQQTRDASSLALKLHDTLASALSEQKPFTCVFLHKYHLC
jgi:folylpolyglutamate synthase